MNVSDKEFLDIFQQVEFNALHFEKNSDQYFVQILREVGLANAAIEDSKEKGSEYDQFNFECFRQGYLQQLFQLYPTFLERSFQKIPLEQAPPHFRFQNIKQPLKIEEFKTLARESASDYGEVTFDLEELPSIPPQTNSNSAMKSTFQSQLHSLQSDQVSSLISQNPPQPHFPSNPSTVQQPQQPSYYQLPTPPTILQTSNISPVSLSNPSPPQPPNPVQIKTTSNSISNLSGVPTFLKKHPLPIDEDEYIEDEIINNNYNHRNSGNQPPNKVPRTEFNQKSPPISEPEEPDKKEAFMTAKEKLSRDNALKNGVKTGLPKKTLGNKRPRTGFIPPFKRDESNEINNATDNSSSSNNSTSKSSNDSKKNQKTSDGKEKTEKQLIIEKMMEDERLKGCDPCLVELIYNEILDRKLSIDWDDIAGLEFAKTTVREIIIYPLLRPDIFKGIRAPPKGLLLFGPPGTGKTMIGKAIASKSNSTFFSISSSALTSKWIGEGEKLVKTLFAVARYFSPSVIFIDEIDSLLTHRSDNENESTRRIKTEFLVQLDGATCSEDDRILLIGATNRPHELDDAARRRLVKRLYIPLPDFVARKTLISHLLSKSSHSLTEEQINKVAKLCDGYSGADIKALVSEAALGPVRSVVDIEKIDSSEVRPISLEDFQAAFNFVRASVSPEDLKVFIEWNKTFGTFRYPES